MQLAIVIIVGILRGLSWLCIADALLSWFQGADSFPRKYTMMITEPLYAPLHKIVSPQMTGGLDLSPIAMILLLNFLANSLAQGGGAM